MNNENAKRQNSIRGTQRFTKPSLTNGNANVQINSNTSNYRREFTQLYKKRKDSVKKITLSFSF